MKPIQKALFIINKFAGTGYQPQVEGKILDACEQNDVECTIEFTNGRGHATDLARMGVNESFDLIVAVGGDGTVNEVAQGLLHSGRPMGILPKGSGNGLARHLGIPVSIVEGLKALFHSEEADMDTFRINEHLSVNVSGLGFDGLIANLFDTSEKRGLAGYVKLTLKELIQFQNFAAEVSYNGSVETRESFIIAVANSSQYGNNARIAPSASVRDRLLNVSFIRKVPYLRVPGFALSFFTGTVNRQPYYDSFTTDRLTIRTPKPFPFHVDGEPCGESNEFNISIDPSSLQVMVPKGHLEKI